MSAIQVDFLLAGLHDDNGAPLAGALVYTYFPGTTIEQTAWTDKDKLYPAQNPVTLDTNGQYQLYCDGWYQFIITDASGNVIDTWDDLAFSPTISEWTAQNYALVFVSPTSFTISGDQTLIFKDNTPVKAIINTGAVYGTVSSSSYGSSVTTVNVTWRYGSINNTLSAVYTGVSAIYVGTGLAASSTTSLLIATGSQSLVVAPALIFEPNILLTIADHTNAANFMQGTVISYDDVTGDLVVDVTVTGGSGTIALWDVGISGPQGPIGVTGPTGSTTAPIGTIGPSGTSLLYATTMSMGTDNKKVATGLLIYTISGSSPYTTIPIAGGTALATGTVPTNKWAIYLYSIDSSGVPVSTPGTANLTTGYVDEATAIADCPDTPSSQTRIGYVTVLTHLNQPFIAGTDALQGGTGGNVALTTHYVVDTPLNDYVGDVTPAPLVYSGLYYVRATYQNWITTPTVNLNGLGAVPIVTLTGAPLDIGDIPDDHYMVLYYDGGSMELLDFKATDLTDPGMEVFTSSGTWIRPNGVKKVFVRIFAGGGGGGGAGDIGPGGNGGAGGYSEGWIDVSGYSVVVTVGGGGTGGTNGAGNSTTGGSSTFVGDSTIYATGGTGGDAGGSGGANGTAGVGVGGMLNYLLYGYGVFGAAGIGSILSGSPGASGGDGIVVVQW